MSSRDAEQRRAAPSGRFVLRMDPGLHATLKRAARETDLSLNEYCVRKLATPGAVQTGAAADAVERAAALLGAHLVGVIAFGSWARGELVEGSDVDLLVVVDDEVEVTRDLYREWDRAPIRWNGRRAEPHFARLAEPRLRAGVWAEVAVEGVILFERGLELSRRLVDLRRQIVAGRWIRRRAHGQPYWVRGA